VAGLLRSAMTILGICISKTKVKETRRTNRALGGIWGARNQTLGAAEPTSNISRVGTGFSLADLSERFNAV